MAMNNRDRVGKGFEHLAEGLFDLVDGVMSQAYGTRAWNEQMAHEVQTRNGGSLPIFDKRDPQVQMKAIVKPPYHFKDELTRGEQSYASELIDARNKWAHNSPFSSEDAVRALDTMERLLRAADANDSADDVRKLRLDLERTVIEDQTRKKAKRALVSLEPGSGLKPWREVIMPHDDVAHGDFTASEFAADLYAVHNHQTVSPEYADPVEFFNRTYLTEGLQDLLSRALRRLAGDKNASSIVNLQTNFGGGKTHSMLALYHLFSGIPARRFPQEVQELVAANGNPQLENLNVRRVALVGTYLRPATPIIKDDGTEVRTLWGELAWQLGGREAYEIVASDDVAGTNPGEALRTLLSQYSPALILIDEWVAYARQLVRKTDLPAGSFETQFTFAQSLSEIVKSIPGTMVVLSIPASDSGDASATDDIEVGGPEGRLALERLQNVIRRTADQWRPSTKDESFEIVRRRLFKDPDAAGRASINAVARAFVTMYRENSTQFPRDAATASNEYEQRIAMSYPLHPELLDRLYEDWSTLERFQRTRGVLKLVSAIVHELWASGDRSPLILPGNVPLDAASVNTDLTQYLDDSWKPIIDADIDGVGSTAYQIDLEKPAFGQRALSRRLARTIFMGAAPRNKSQRKGLDKQYVWLGTAVPGDQLGNYGMALDLLGQRCTYFFTDQGHYWFDTQPSVTKTANDYADRLREDEETVWNEIARRLQENHQKRGAFDRVHTAVQDSADVPDLEATRLVIAHPRYTYQRQDNESAAGMRWARSVIESHGSGTRTHRNSVVILMADGSQREGLESAVRFYLGWQKVRTESDTLNLSAQQVHQADRSIAQFDHAVKDRIRDTYIWAVYPQQSDVSQGFTMEATKVRESAGKSLAERVSIELQRGDLLVTQLAPAILGTTLHTTLKAVWDSEGGITVGQLWAYFTRYIYLSRLANRDVLDRCVHDALTAILVKDEAFAIASGYDEENGRFYGLVTLPNPSVTLQVTDSTRLVSVDRAEAQISKEAEARAADPSGSTDGVSGGAVKATENSSERHEGNTGALPGGAGTDHRNPGDGTDELPWHQPTRYSGSVDITSERYGTVISNVVREIIDPLQGTGANLSINITITATKTDGFNENSVRTIKENSRQLGFDQQSGFDD
jgi:predicted AAA+ superfamily ATPase